MLPDRQANAGQHPASRITGGWAVAVDDTIVTGSAEWPHDNPTIDLTLVIETDGSVAVQDT